MAKKNNEEKGTLELTSEEIADATFEDQQELNAKLDDAEVAPRMEGEGEPSDAQDNLDIPRVDADPDFVRQLANRPEEEERILNALGVDVVDPNSPDDVVTPKTIARKVADIGEKRVVDTTEGGNVDGAVQAFRTAGPAQPAEGQKYTSSAAAFAPQSAWYAPQPPTEYGYDIPENDNIDPIETDGINDLKDRNRREGGVIDPTLNGDLRRLKVRV